jgi:hypothetical protein
VVQSVPKVAEFHQEKIIFKKGMGRVPEAREIRRDYRGAPPSRQPQRSRGLPDSVIHKASQAVRDAVMKNREKYFCCHIWRAA